MRKSTPLNFHQCQTHHVTITVKWQFEREYSYPTDIELKVKKTEWCFYPAIDDESSLMAEFELFCYNAPFFWSFSEAKTNSLLSQTCRQEVKFLWMNVCISRYYIFGRNSDYILKRPFFTFQYFINYFPITNSKKYLGCLLHGDLHTSVKRVLS